MAFDFNMVISGIAIIAAFGTAFYITKRWIPAAKYFGLVGKDMNKYGHPEVAEGGGVSVIMGISAGLFTYLFLKAFIFNTGDHVTEIYAIISTILIAGFLGFSDDILGWKKGLRQSRKVIFSSATVLPIVTLVLLNPQYNTFTYWGIPLWFYALIIVPVGIIGATNAVNMVAGYNGLEAGLGIIILLTIAIHAFVLGEFWIAYIAVIGGAALLGFIIFNWYPAKVFPGDSLTYPLGAFIGTLVIVGNMEIFGILIFPLYFLKFGIYLYYRFIKHEDTVEEFGIPDQKNYLSIPNGKITGVAHLLIMLQRKFHNTATERGVVITAYILQIGISIVALWISNLFA